MFTELFRNFKEEGGLNPPENNGGRLITLRSPEGEPESTVIKRLLIKNTRYRKDAYYYFEGVKQYAERNHELYPPIPLNGYNHILQ